MSDVTQVGSRRARVCCVVIRECVCSLKSARTCAKHDRQCT